MDWGALRKMGRQRRDRKWAAYCWRMVAHLCLGGCPDKTKGYDILKWDEATKQQIKANLVHRMSSLGLFYEGMEPTLSQIQRHGLQFS